MGWGHIFEELYENYSHRPLWMILLVVIGGGILFFILLSVLLSL
jgi:hypothetical protein